jgi:hypothetical protein
MRHRMAWRTTKVHIFRPRTEATSDGCFNPLWSFPRLSRRRRQLLSTHV